MKPTKTFETSMERLEQIVTLMEEGECSLDESLKLYEEAVKLADFCSKRIAGAKLQIENFKPGAETDEDAKNE